MKSRWKRTLAWSSFSGVALGTAVAVMRLLKKAPPRPLVCWSIPAESQRILLWTESFPIAEDNREIQAHDWYLLQPTPFKVWSLVDPALTAEGGVPIYHCTHFRVIGIGGEKSGAKEERLVAKLYATVQTIGLTGEACSRNALARGGLLELRDCRVGGARNGVETGEVHRSAAPILNYRFEYTPI